MPTTNSCTTSKKDGILRFYVTDDNMETIDSMFEESIRFDSSLPVRPSINSCTLQAERIIAKLYRGIQIGGRSRQKPSTHSPI